MTSPVDPIALAIEVSRLLDTLTIVHTVGGSIASSFAGEPRSTIDIDIVAAIREPDIEPLVAALSADFYVDAAAVRRAVREKGTANLIHQATQLKIDLFVAGGLRSISSSCSVVKKSCSVERSNLAPQDLGLRTDRGRTKDEGRTKNVLVRLRAYPEGVVRDYIGERPPPPEFAVGRANAAARPAAAPMARAARPAMDSLSSSPASSSTRGRTSLGCLTPSGRRGTASSTRGSRPAVCGRCTSDSGPGGSERIRSRCPRS